MAGRGTDAAQNGGALGAEIQQMDYLTRMNALLQVKDSTFALIKDLVQDNEQQRERISKLEFGLEDEKDAKDKWRGRFLELSKEAEKADHNPYVALLIDGDGMIFTENYLLHPQAGQTTATVLLQHTRELISNSGLCDPIDVFEIVIRVFGNVNGLTEAFQSRGLQLDFRNFAVGFSQPKAMVDFVDVGWGKEMADSKIAGELRFHLSNHNCKHVILGASHDNGYARILGSLVAEGVDRSRILLLEGVPFGREFKTLPFTRVKYPNMFLSQKIENWIPESVQQYSKGRSRHHIHNTSQPNSHESGAYPCLVNPILQQGGRGKKTGQADIRGMSMPPPPPYQPASQDQVLLSQNPPQTTYPPPIPRPTVAMLQRIGGLKPAPCYAHYLSKGPGAGCPGKCGYSHSYTLTPELFQALAFLAQSLRCHSGNACNRPYCIYGHQCQVVGICTGHQCVFKPEEHAPGKYKPTSSAVPSISTPEPQSEFLSAPKSGQDVKGAPQKLSKGQKKRLKKHTEISKRAAEGAEEASPAAEPEVAAEAEVVAIEAEVATISQS